MSARCRLAEVIRTRAHTVGDHQEVLSRGVSVDHATINRWVVKYSPQLEEAFHRRKQPVWASWRLDESYIRVKGQWRYLYRAVDKYGQTIDFLLTEHRDTEAALRFLKKAICRNGLPETITIDGSDANEVEQDHRGVKRITRPILGFKSFKAAQVTLAGIELMHMLKKQQLMVESGNEGLTVAQQFSALAA